MTVREMIRKYCKPVLESKFLEKMEDTVLNYRVEREDTAQVPAHESEQGK